MISTLTYLVMTNVSPADWSAPVLEEKQLIGRARDAGKPVVVSMGNMAGSGGYFVANNIYSRLVVQDVFDAKGIGPDLAEQG